MDFGLSFVFTVSLCYGYICDHLYGVDIGLAQNSHFMRSFGPFFVPTYTRTVIKSDSRVPLSVAIMLMVLAGDRMTR